MQVLWASPSQPRGSGAQELVGHFHLPLSFPDCTAKLSRPRTELKKDEDTSRPGSAVPSINWKSAPSY